MTSRANQRRAAGREAMAWLSFAVVLASVMGFGAIFLFRDVPAYLSYDMQRTLSGWEVIGTAVVGIVVMCALVYIGAIAWLVLARLFFTREEVSKVVFYGPTTRFERWLVDKFFLRLPNDKRG